MHWSATVNNALSQFTVFGTAEAVRVFTAVKAPGRTKEEREVSRVQGLVVEICAHMKIREWAR
jgi:hypothetical protein